MTVSAERAARRSVHERYGSATPTSAGLFERAGRVLPGGSTRTTTFSQPYPPYIRSGRGAVLADVDGNTYLDFLGNYTSLIVGHANPEVVAAVEAQLRRGAAFAAPTELEIALAEELVRRLPSIERIRFANSGTEATMFALRLARAHTGRDVIARFGGAYHGTHDLAMVGTPGVPDGLAGLVVDLPFNDLAGVERALTGRESSVAAIIIEPIQGVAGMVPAEIGFLAGLRDYTRRHGMLLIFDEVITFRVGPAGAQGRYGVVPDLTALGKIIGGGHPVGAFGGSAAIMDRFDARRPDALVHGGTFNGNPITMAAGVATLRQLTPPVYERLEALGDRLRAELTAGFASAGIDARVTGLASLFQVHLGATGDSGSLATGRAAADPAAAAAARERAARFHLGLLLAGYLTAPRGMGALMTPLTEDDVDGFVAAAVDAAAEALVDPVRP